MTETTETTYDPIPGLAWLLGSAQRLALGIDSTPGVVTFARRLIEGLGLPYMATAEEAEAAIRKALEPAAAPVRQVDLTAPSDSLTYAEILTPGDVVVVVEIEPRITPEEWNVEPQKELGPLPSRHYPRD